MRYLRTFLKSWVLYLIPLLIVPLVTTAMGYQSLMLYQSAALIYVDKPVFLTVDSSNPWLSPADNQAMSMSELLQSESFVTTIAQQTDLAKMLDLTTENGRNAAYSVIGSELSVYATGRGPNTIVVSATDKSPHLAQQIVQASVTEFTSYFQSHRVQLDQQGIGFYEQQLATAQSQYAQDSAKLTDYLNRHPGASVTGGSTDPTLTSLTQQAAQDQTTITTLQAQIDSLRSDSQAATTGTATFLRVLDQPQLPLQPTLALRKLAMTYTLGGLGGAAGLDVAIIVLLTLLNRKVYFTEDLRKIGDDLELDGIMIEKLPNLATLGGGRPRPWIGGRSSSMLSPVMAALPRLHTRSVSEGFGSPVG